MLSLRLKSRSDIVFSASRISANAETAMQHAYHNNKFHDVVAIDNDEVLLLMPPVA